MSAAHAESFAQLLEESIAKTNMRPGSVVRGKVMAVDKDFVVVNAGLKSDAVISADQFKNEQGDLEVIVGDEVDVAIEAIEDGYGETRLSREKAKRLEAWTTLTRMFEAGQTVLGTISGKVKGGFTVEIGAVRAFLPGSLVDVRPVRDSSFLEGKELEFKIIKIDQKRNNVVVSRRSVMESATSAERETLLSSLQEGQVVKGIVKNLTDYGAFIDLGGVDGLLHITDMAWKRVKHPSEVVAVGDEITVKILKFDRERTRVSLGLKQLAEDPWADIARRYPEGARLVGKVTNLTDYGCFVEIEPGVEGLVHVSEMDWTNKNIHPSKVVSVGDEVEVMVLDIDEERRRISLGIKQCKANPWEAFAATHQKNDRVRGKIKSITDFGIFIGLDGGIDGLIHLTDISWNVPGEEMIRNYKKGDELEAVVLAVDAERERISLGIKQLEQDPFNNFVATHNKNDMLKGTITSVDAKGAVIDLGEGVEGYLRASEISSDRVDDARTHLKVDQELEARFVGIERKKRMINLSLKAKGAEDDFVDEPISSSTTFGDILKEKMGQQNSDDE